MRTFKSFCLSVLPRAVDMRDRCYLSLNVFAAFDMSAEPKLLLEQNLWRFLPTAAPGFMEAGMPKVRSEYLVFGNAFAPAGASVSRGHVGVRFAGRAKALTVWGERYWDGREISAPAPYSSVPLGWSGGFGGDGFAENPSGLGFVAGTLPAAGLALPRFEDPVAPWARQNERNKAVAFAPVEIDNPKRTRFQGTYDDTWLKQRSPGMPADFDWRFFQVAPEDQQFEQPLVGNEAYELHNLHPGIPVIRGELPGICPSAFIRRVGHTDLEPVPTTLRTVLFFPEQHRLVLIWQGVAKTADDELGDLSHLLVGAERLGSPKPYAHYQRVFDERADRDKGMLAALREDDLLPEGLAFEPLVSVDGVLTAEPAPHSFAARSKQRAEQHFQAARATVASYGLDPDEHAPPAKLPQRPMPTEVKDLPAFFAELQRESEAQRAIGHKAVEASLRATELQLAPFGYDGSIVRNEIKAPPSGPPALVAPARIEGLKGLAAFSQSSGVHIGEVSEMAGDAKLHAEWHEGDRRALEQYRQAAHHQVPASRAEARYANRQQEWVRARLQAKEPLSGFDLTGADLRGFDLRGANLDNAMLESALLEEVHFEGATLRGAVLAHAKLRGAILAGCNLTRCNLGKADLTQADASQAVFVSAILSEANLTGATLRAARFEQAQVLGVIFNAANLDGACLDALLLSDTQFDGASLVGTLANRTIFMKASLAQANLTGLQGTRAVFYAIDAQQLVLDGALLDGASFVEGSQLTGCSLRKASLVKAFARGTGFRGCDFSEARLDGAMLMHADLSDARLPSASAIETNFMRAELRNADFRGANLRGAMLTAAQAHGTQFAGANLFGSDLARIAIDAATSFDNTLLKKARLYPRAPLAEPRP